MSVSAIQPVDSQHQPTKAHCFSLSQLAANKFMDWFQNFISAVY